MTRVGLARPLALLTAAVALSVGMAGHAAAPEAPFRVVVAARALQPGELVMLTATLPDAATSVRVTAFGRDIPAFGRSDRRWTALVGIDVDEPPGAYTASIAARVGGEMVRVEEPLVVGAKAFPTRRLTVDPAFVRPPAAALARIAAEAAFLRDVYAATATTRLWTGPIVRPVPDPATSRFGARSVFNGEPRRPHAGADFQSPAGRPVRAPLAGQVLAARELYFTGRTVVIDHGLGLVSLLAHLSRMDVNEGDAVAAGQVIGLVGATGRVTGPHLHWALSASGARVDPLSALAVLE